MIDDKTGIEKNPLNLLHPVIYNKETEQQAKLAINLFKQDNLPQRPSNILTRENIIKTKEHKWLKDCETILYNAEDYFDEQDFISEFLEELEDNSEMLKEEICLKEPKKVIALDLETIGLNKTIKKIGGLNKTYNSIVGVCIAVSDTKGYYIPVRHNGLDNVQNFRQETIVNLLQQLVDKFHIIYHNASFDMEVLALSGVRFNLNYSFSDTMILSILNGYRITYRQVGLKFLAKELLERPMLEINELMGQKSYIMMQNIPASNAYVYGCSDAMNTYGLFNYILSDENPYTEQKNVTILEHKMVQITNSLLRVGIPVDYESALSALKTMIRRSIMLEQIFYYSISEDILISSAEQIGTHIYSLLKKEFENKYCPGHIINKGEKGFKILCDRLYNDFGMTVKVKELKTGTKVVSNLDENAISSLYSNLETWDYVSEQVSNEIYIICEVLMEYRSLQHELNIFYKMVRFCYNDDLNVCRTGIGLKLMGADTLRYSNQSSRGGSFDNIKIQELKTKTNTTYVPGDGITGFNAQGLSNKSGKFVTLKKVQNFKDLDQEMTSKWGKLNKMVEVSLIDLFKSGKYITVWE